MTTATRPRRNNCDHEMTALIVDVHAAWRDHAACAGLDMNPAEDSPGESEALKVCDTCPVLRDCRRWVMPLNEYTDPGGICGGMTERGRTRLRVSTAIKAGMATAADSKKEAVMTTTSQDLYTRPQIAIVPEPTRSDSTPAADLEVDLKQPAALLALIARTLGMLAGFEDATVVKEIGRANTALVQLEEALTIGERRRQAEADLAAAEQAVADAKARLKQIKTGKAAIEGEPTPKEIRTWANAEGIPVAPNGLIPASVRQQYDAAHR
jgi:hypothetical protein